MHFQSQAVSLERGGVKISELKALIAKDDPVIVEIGANDGETTEAFLREMPRACIYCFEPDPRAVRKFKAKPASTRVKLFECAVGNENGFVTFHQSSSEGEVQDWDRSGSIRKPKRHSETWPWVKFEKQITVPIVRLDDWAARENIGAIDLVWADVQGAESDVIFGGMSTLRNTRFFYTEYGEIEWYEGQISLDQLCDNLAKLGLFLFRRFSIDALFINSGTNDLASVKLRRNAPCLCGSGLRYKHCHGAPRK